MNRAKLFIFLLFAAACLAAPLVVHISAHQRQVDRERALQEQTRHLAELSAARDQSSTPAQPSAAPALSDADHSELLHLRSEIGRLRQQTNSVQQLQDENHKLAAQPASASGSTGTFYARESWAFAGYATPDATLQSFIWATSQGDMKTALNCLRGPMAEQMTAQLARATDPDPAKQMASAANNISGFRVITREALPDDEMLVQFEPIVASMTNTHQEIVKMKKFDDGWKIISEPR